MRKLRLREADNLPKVAQPAVTEVDPQLHLTLGSGVHSTSHTIPLGRHHPSLEARADCSLPDR